MIDYNKKVVFVHVPKTGGESITKMFWNTRLCLATGKHLTANQYRTNFDLEDFYFFSMVRNPYDRAKSHFRYLKQYHNPPRIDCDFDTWISNPHGAVEYLFYPQSFYIDERTEFFKFENWNESIQKICKKTGLTFSRPIHINATSKKQTDHNFSNFVINKINDLYDEDFRRFNYVKISP